MQMTEKGTVSRAPIPKATAPIADKIKAIRDAIEKSASQAVTADMFISIVRKYTRAKKLTPRMLNELVHRIEVHQAEKVNGVREQ